MSTGITSGGRANALWALLPVSAQEAIDREYGRGLEPRTLLEGKGAWLRDVSESFWAHARDQRNTCSDAANAVDYSHGSFTEFQNRVTSAVLRAPSPGMER